MVVPDFVNAVPDNGWRNQSKHVEQFTDKINGVGYLLAQNYDARSHEHEMQY